MRTSNPSLNSKTFERAAPGTGVMTIGGTVNKVGILLLLMLVPASYMWNKVLTAWEPSDDGRLLVYAVSAAGSDWQDLHVRDVDRGVDLDDHLRWAKFVTISWLGDSSGFYYTRFPDEGSYHPFVCVHRLGSQQYEDHTVFGPPDDPEIVYEVDQSSDRRFLAITAFKGASENSAVTIVERRPDDAPGRGSVHWSVSEFAHAWHFIDASGDDLLLRTNLDAPRGRIVAVRPSRALRCIVGETQDSLVDAHLVGGRLAAVYLRNATSRVCVFEIDGGSVGDLPLPALGSVTELRGEADGDELFLRFASFCWPPSVLRALVTDLSVTAFDTGGTHVDPRGYQTEQAWYSSKDGTRVPIWTARRSGSATAAAAGRRRCDGRRPTTSRRSTSTCEIGRAHV